MRVIISEQQLVINCIIKKDSIYVVDEDNTVEKVEVNRENHSKLVQKSKSFRPCDVWLFLEPRRPLR